MNLTTLLLLAAGGSVIGGLLTMLGAGGSILLLPLLISGAALPAQEAVPLSLLVVTVLALANVGPALRHRQIALKPALVLGLPAVAGSLIGAGWVRHGLISEPVQLGVFALAALLASWLMTRPQPNRREGQPSGRPPGPGRQTALAVQGMLVGLLTGIAGVGGGFAVVPALVLLAGLPMPIAAGTSLLLIALNAVVALVALQHWPAASLPLLVPLLLGGGLGIAIGQRLAPHLSEKQLRRGFAALLLGSALLSGVEAWKRQPSAAASLSSPLFRSSHGRPSVPLPPQQQARRPRR